MDIDKIIEEISDMYPYKKVGDRNSYSEYNEGWSDACDILGQRIKEYFSTRIRNIQESELNPDFLKTVEKIENNLRSK